MEKQKLTKGDFIAIIPARYASTRFPGKPLAKLNGKEVILHVCDRVRETGMELMVATDDERIRQCVENAGYKTVMTSSSHRSGTDRIAEAYRNAECKQQIVINVQGDEPFIDPESLRKLMDAFNDDSVEIATLVKKFDKNENIDTLFNSNLVKVCFNNSGDALYFSRSVIPNVRGREIKEWPDAVDFYTHIGVYAYKYDILKSLTTLQQSSLEVAESLEQLRWLQSGYKIRTVVTDYSTIGIDTPEDLQNACLYLKKLKATK